MSDLQCPATLLVARHGDVAEVRELVDALRERKVAAVSSSHLPRAVDSAAVAAAALGVGSRVVAGLEELSGGEGEHEVLERYRGALEEIADLHRGETVLVFSHSGVMSLCLPRMGGHVRDDLAARVFLPHCAVAEVSIDADDVTILSWPGSAGRSVD